MLNVFLLKSLEAETTGLRTDFTNVGTMAFVFSGFVEEWGWVFFLFFLRLFFPIKHIVNCKHYI